MREQMRLLVAGNTGQLAKSLLQRAELFGAQIIPIDENNLESLPMLEAQINDVKPDFVINLIGICNQDYTNTLAESLRQKIVDIATNLAVATNNAKIPIIHLSGYHIFDGKNETPNSEGNAPSPDCELGRIGLIAEDKIAQHNQKHVILRTSWLYGPDSLSLFHKMINLAGLEDDLTYVARKRMGSPTSVYSLADGIFEIVANLQSMKDNRELWGIFHIANSGIISQLRFARYISAYYQKITEKHGVEVKNQNYDAIAGNVITRNAVLDCEKLLYSHGIALDDWRRALRNILDESFGQKND